MIRWSDLTTIEKRALMLGALVVVCAALIKVLPQTSWWRKMTDEIMVAYGNSFLMTLDLNLQASKTPHLVQGELGTIWFNEAGFPYGPEYDPKNSPDCPFVFSLLYGSEDPHLLSTPDQPDPQAKYLWVPEIKRYFSGNLNDSNHQCVFVNNRWPGVWSWFVDGERTEELAWSGLIYDSAQGQIMTLGKKEWTLR